MTGAAHRQRRRIVAPLDPGPTAAESLREDWPLARGLPMDLHDATTDPKISASGRGGAGRARQGKGVAGCGRGMCGSHARGQGG